MSEVSIQFKNLERKQQNELKKNRKKEFLQLKAEMKKIKNRKTVIPIHRYKH